MLYCTKLVMRARKSAAVENHAGRNTVDREALALAAFRSHPMHLYVWINIWGSMWDSIWDNMWK
jgi:hypothetical protein